MTYQGLIHRYGHLLDLPAHTQNISLLEGNTPLIPMPRLGKEFGCELFVKFEGLNPTGSFKDRGMTAAISEAVGRGAQTVICASTGNTAASAAAYASRAGLRSIVLIPEGKVAAGKLAGAIAYGAEVIQIQGSFDDALSLVVEITQKTPIALVNSINPYRVEGQKTAAFEICDVLAMRLTGYVCQLEMRATSRPIGRDSSSIKKDCRKYWVCRPQGLLRWCWDILLTTLRRSRQPFALADPRAGSRHLKLPNNPMAGSSQFQMRKYCQRRKFLQAKGFGWNLLQRQDLLV